MLASCRRSLGPRAQLPRRVIRQWQKQSRTQISTRAIPPESSGKLSPSIQKLLLAATGTAVVVANGFAYANATASPLRVDAHKTVDQQPILDKGRLPTVQYATFKEMEKVIIQDCRNG
jgi:hypothetical protein